MKSIKVLPTRTTIPSTETIPNYNKVAITSDEGWQLSVNCQEDDKKTDREMAQFCFFLADNTQLLFTMQDLLSIPAIISNAKNELMQYAEHKFSDKTRESDVLSSIQELEHLLSLFKK